MYILCIMIFKTNNRLRKIRVIMKPAQSAPAYGVVLPTQLMEKWKGVSVKVTESGTALILESGALPISFSKKQINTHSKKLSVIEI